MARQSDVSQVAMNPEKLYRLAFVSNSAEIGRTIQAFADPQKIHIDIRPATMEQAVPVARELLASGVEVILGGGATGKLLRETLDEPVVTIARTPCRRPPGLHQGQGLRFGHRLHQLRRAPGRPGSAQGAVGRHDPRGDLQHHPGAGGRHHPGPWSRAPAAWWQRRLPGDRRLPGPGGGRGHPGQGQHPARPWTRPWPSPRPGGGSAPGPNGFASSWNRSARGSSAWTGRGRSTWSIRWPRTSWASTPRHRPQGAPGGSAVPHRSGSGLTSRSFALSLHAEPYRQLYKDEPPL